MTQGKEGQVAIQRAEAEQRASTPCHVPDTQWQQHCQPKPSSPALCQPPVLVAVLKLITTEMKAAVVSPGASQEAAGSLHSHSQWFSFCLFCLGVKTGSFSQGHSQALVGDPAEFLPPPPALHRVGHGPVSAYICVHLDMPA